MIICVFGRYDRICRDEKAKGSTAPNHKVGVSASRPILVVIQSRGCRYIVYSMAWRPFE